MPSLKIESERFSYEILIEPDGMRELDKCPLEGGQKLLSLEADADETEPLDRDEFQKLVTDWKDRLKKLAEAGVVKKSALLALAEDMEDVLEEPPLIRARLSIEWIEE